MRGLVFDMRAMLLPIQGSPGGAGPCLSEDCSPASPFYRLRDIRSSARRQDRENDASADVRIRRALSAEWNGVLQAALDCLGQTRDFEVACWFTEAAALLHGVPGAIIGIELLNGLCERYWHAGHPAVSVLGASSDDDNLLDRDSRIAALFGDKILGTMMKPLWVRPLYVADDGAVSLHDLCRVLHIPTYAELDAGTSYRGGAEARHCGPDSRAAVAELAQDAPRLLAACIRLAAHLARRLPATSNLITARALDFADAVQEAAEILPAEGASQRLYC